MSNTNEQAQSQSDKQTPFYLKLGDRIKQARKKTKLTQEDIGNALNISRVSVNNIENGKYRPSLYFICIIAQLLNVKLDYFVNDSSGSESRISQLESELKTRDDNNATLAKWYQDSRTETERLESDLAKSQEKCSKYEGALDESAKQYVEVVYDLECQIENLKEQLNGKEMILETTEKTKEMWQRLHMLRGQLDNNISDPLFNSVVAVFEELGYDMTDPEDEPSK